MKLQLCTKPNLNIHARLVYNNFGFFCDGQRLCYRRTTTFQVFTLFCFLFLTTIHIWLMDKVNLIESLLYHLLNNLPTSEIATHSQSPLKKCLKLVVFYDCYLYLIPLRKYETIYKVNWVWIRNKVDLIDSLSYQLLTNLTTTCSQP